MIISNEPGYYKAGEFGIRIENLVAVISSLGKYLAFETITCVPIDTRLVDAFMLSREEKEWLNKYHAWVLSRLSEELEIHERAWLKERCAAIF